MDGFRIRPLTPDLTDDFVALFGPQGACYGCWCSYFRLRPKLRQALDGDGKRDVMLARIRSGPPPGLIGYLGEEPVAWMQIGPRADVPEWNNPGRVSAPLPDGAAGDGGVWAISCFFFRARHRGKGLSHPMLQGGIGFARDAGARLLEAAPMERAKQAKSIGLFVGSASVFRKAGFAEVASHKQGRPLMRLVL
jgi:GNAT superfamily N-acetyltransferase